MKRVLIWVWIAAGMAVLAAATFVTTLMIANRLNSQSIPSQNASSTVSLTTSSTITLTTTSLSSFTPQYRTVIYDCQNIARTVPANIILTCADGGVSLQNLQWSEWGSYTADAEGLLVVDNCIPYCAVGTELYYQVSVEVSGLSDIGYTIMDIVGGPSYISKVNLTTDGPGIS
jgi:hypothetical protein